MSDVQKILVEPAQSFYEEAAALVAACTKPNGAEFVKVAKATSVGFLIMGMLGFLVKLIHIPINNVLVGGN